MISAVICEFDTSIIYHLLVNCFGSFLWQDLFSSLKVFAFKGQNITFTVNVLLTRIPYSVTPGPAIIRAVCEYSRLILIVALLEPMDWTLDSKLASGPQCPLD